MKDGDGVGGRTCWSDKACCDMLRREGCVDSDATYVERILEKKRGERLRQLRLGAVGNDHGGDFFWARLRF